MSRGILRGILFVLIGLTATACAPASAFSDDKSLFERLSLPLVALVPKDDEFRSFPPPTISPEPVRHHSVSPPHPESYGKQASSVSFFSRPSAGWCRDRLKYGVTRIVSDYRNLYNGHNLLNFGVALGGAAILANTSMDRDFRNWFLRESDAKVSRYGTPDGHGNVTKFSWTAKGLGEPYIVGLFAVSALGYCLTEDSDLGRGQPLFGEYVMRTTRAYLAGFPALFLGQYTLGAGRPTRGAFRENKGESNWHFFNGDMAGMSGHAFIGAMPFITAAQMTDNYWLKGVFYTCSTFSAWSRLYWDAHYLSQVFLGWYVAYLSVRAVSKTEGTRLPKGLTVFPVCDGDGVGFGVSFRR